MVPEEEEDEREVEPLPVEPTDDRPDVVSHVAPLDEGEPRLVAEVELLEKVLSEELEQAPTRVENAPLRDGVVEVIHQVSTDVHELDHRLLCLVHHL